MKKALWLAGVLCLLGAAAPTTAPTTARADQSTPKGALKVFARALDAGERKTILEILVADSDQDKKVAAATADLAEASAVLRAAALKHFGQANSRALGVDPTSSTEAILRIDAATETIDGEKATVRSADNEGPPMAMIRREGKWLVPVSELSKDVEAADIDRNLVDIAGQIKVMRELAVEVATGKHASAIDARQALDQRIVRGVMPATGPATAPATSVSPPPG